MSGEKDTSGETELMTALREMYQLLLRASAQQQTDPLAHYMSPSVIVPQSVLRKAEAGDQDAIAYLESLGIHQKTNVTREEGDDATVS